MIKIHLVFYSTAKFHYTLIRLKDLVEMTCRKIDSEERRWYNTALGQWQKMVVKDLALMGIVWNSPNV